jgi:hypothetical protein
VRALEGKVEIVCGHRDGEELLMTMKVVCPE